MCVCTLHDIGQQDGSDFLVVEYLEGETLAQRLRKGALLRIDPEDLQAHYNVMLSHHGGHPEATAVDESAQAITGSFRRASPENNSERQPIHEHPQTPPS